MSNTWVLYILSYLHTLYIPSICVSNIHVYTDSFSVYYTYTCWQFQYTPHFKRSFLTVSSCYHGSCACMIGKAPLQTSSIVQAKMFSWPSVCISVTMEIPMKRLFLSDPDSWNARWTFMNPSNVASILRIGLLLVIYHPSEMSVSSVCSDCEFPFTPWRIWPSVDYGHPVRSWNESYTTRIKQTYSTILDDLRGPSHLRVPPWPHNIQDSPFTIPWLTKMIQ
jgi:hypothetical protein